MFALFAATEASVFQIGIDDFGSGATTFGYEGLDLGIENPSPATLDGDTYSTASGTFRIFEDFGSDYLGTAGDAIGTHGEPDHIEISLGSSVQKLGMTVGTLSDFTTSISFYSSTELLGNILGSGSLVLPFFAGWDAGTGSINRVVIAYTDSNGLVLFMDDLIKESAAQLPPMGAEVPLPATLPLLLGAVGGLAFARRRHG